MYTTIDNIQGKASLQIENVEIRLGNDWTQYNFTTILRGLFDQRILHGEGQIHLTIKI